MRKNSPIGTTIEPSPVTLKCKCLVALTMVWPLIFVVYALYGKLVNPGGYAMGIGFVYLFALVAQIAFSILTATVCNKSLLPILALIAFLALIFIT